jgi:hypothetical protein
MASTKEKQKRLVPAGAALPTPTKQKVSMPPKGAIWISASQVRARYGDRSDMWLNRKLMSDPDFPKPMYSGRLRFFRLDELEQYEKLAVKRGKPDIHTKAEA